MATVIFNKKIEKGGVIDKKGKAVWIGHTGATKDALYLINKTEKEYKANKPYNLRIGFYKGKKNHFLFINREDENPKEKVGVFFDYGYSFKFHSPKQKEPIFFERSIAKLEEAVLAILREGEIIEKISYKGRNGSYYYRFTGDRFEAIEEYEFEKIMNKNEMKEL